MDESISPDYLIIGAGAMGMAFVDTMLTDTKANIVIVDRYDRPGGHWTVAYPFVRLHQPSEFYGVNSRRLGEGQTDHVGWNKGLSELATADEILSYYSTVMQRTFLPSGRVSYYPKHEYLGDGKFRSLTTEKTFQVTSNTHIVDATFMKVKVPSMAPPAYEVAEGVMLTTPNNLPKVSRRHNGYTVVGAGKTGIDSCLWLLAQGVNPDNITWIMPRDSWYIERGGLQPGPAWEKHNTASILATNSSVMAASSLEDLFERLESYTQLTRLDQKRSPSMFRCASVSLAELHAIRQIKNIIRLGRVIRLENDKAILERGLYTPVPDTLYIDCTADGLAKINPVPVFQGRQITLQAVRYCQQVFSAAFIAHVEATYEDEQLKSDLCQAVPHPDQCIDYLRVTLQSHRNGLRWSSQPKTAAWLGQARLDWFGTLLPQPPEDPVEAEKFYAAVKANVEGLCAKLEQLLNQSEGNVSRETNGLSQPEPASQVSTSV